MLRSYKGVCISSILSGSLLQKTCLSSYCYAASAHTHTHSLRSDCFSVLFQGVFLSMTFQRQWQLIVTRQGVTSTSSSPCLHVTVHRPIQNPHRNLKRCNSKAQNRKNQSFMVHTPFDTSRKKFMLVLCTLKLYIEYGINGFLPFQFRTKIRVSGDKPSAETDRNWQTP